MRKKIYLFLTIILLNLDFTFAQTQSNSTMPKYLLWYNEQSSNNGGCFRPNETNRPIDIDWENSSLPIGNGFMGASIFGRIDTERIQISDKTLHIKGIWGFDTQTPFANLYLDFFHTNHGYYKRSLDLNNALCDVEYEHNGTIYKREYLASYPDNIIAIKIKSNKSKSITFTVRAEIPYLVPYGPLNRKDSVTIGYLSGNTVSRHSYNGRIGKVIANKDNLIIRGETEYLKMIYEGRLNVINYGGIIKSENDLHGENGKIHIENADSAVILFTLGTNYKLSSNIFSLPYSKKLEHSIDPHENVVKTIKQATQKGYDRIKLDHIKDYKNYFDRVSLDLNEKCPDIPTNILLKRYKSGTLSKYLEQLMFQYGRYLLISTSRKGCLPPNLQGVWNQYEQAPWNGNYTHNINIQMNYWPVFSTNLTELFESYVDYYKSYHNQAEKIATDYLKKIKLIDSNSLHTDNGWTIGSAAGAFFIGSPGGHSGPGTGGLTTKLFWDYYSFTSDKNILKDISAPAIIGMAKFFTKCVRDTLNGIYAYPSASPEQFSKITRKPYQSVGCAFDQQMIYETYKDALEAAKILNCKDPVLNTIKKQINKLNPVNIGNNGQIKEYLEENNYDDIVLEKHHRHISNLIGLYPGTIINSNTPTYLNAAKVSLNFRGDKSTGWSMAHKLNLWARTKDGKRSYEILKSLIQTAVFDNLWTNCIDVLRSPFQIDANFGTTAGISEMLLQSHENFIEPLPAIPLSWDKGEYNGLVARGNFVFSVKWNNSTIDKMIINSRSGNLCKIHYKNISNYSIMSGNKRVNINILNENEISFETKKNQIFYIKKIK